MVYREFFYFRSRIFGKIEIKIPGSDINNSTSWMDITKLYITGFDYENWGGTAPYDMNEYGALSGAPTGGTGDFTVPFTFGAKNNALSGNMIAVRIVYFGANPSQVAASKQRIITMIELLPIE